MAMLLVILAESGCIARSESRNEYVDCAALLSTPTPGASMAAATPCPWTDAARLEAYVRMLSIEIGPRSYRRTEALQRASEYIYDEFSRLAADGRLVRVLPYTVPTAWMEELARKSASKCPEYWDRSSRVIRSTAFTNVELTLKGETDEVVVVGAHYDSDACESHGCNPGADDNASGVAALFEVARRLTQRQTPHRTIKFVAFTNEEEPFFQTCAMGSFVYAARAFEAGAASERVVAMISLETLGYYSDEAGSQDYGDLAWLASLLHYPDAGNFVAFVGNSASRSLADGALRRFQSPTPGPAEVAFPAEALSASEWLPGVSWSDQWSYWQFGAPAVMATDTALNRNRCYHKLCDRPERLDYERMAIVVEHLADVVAWAASVEFDPPANSGRSHLAAQCLEHLPETDAPTPPPLEVNASRPPITAPPATAPSLGP